jgi:hypothetical protein
LLCRLQKVPALKMAETLHALRYAGQPA